MTRITVSQASTSAEHGKRPEARTLDERMMAGIILLDKATGPTSHQLTAWAKELLGIEKMGHGGTLDPFATGVLPLLLGRSMRLTSGLLSHSKTYVAVLRVHGGVDMERIEAAIEQQRGRIYNVPPDISAVKVQVRTRRIDRLEILDDDSEHVVLEIDCEAGTYIRTMARDIGLLIGKKTELVELRRTASGIFSIENCVTMEQLADAWWLYSEKGDDSAINQLIQPMELLVASRPSVVIKDSAAASIAHGAPLLRPGIVNMPENLKPGDEVSLNSIKGELVATAEMLLGSQEILSIEQGEVARSTAVLLPTGVYPRHKK